MDWGQLHHAVGVPLLLAMMGAGHVDAWGQAVYVDQPAAPFRVSLEEYHQMTMNQEQQPLVGRCVWGQEGWGAVACFDSSSSSSRHIAITVDQQHVVRPSSLCWRYIMCS